ncbi:3-hydroxyisobutyrate dehydrogenase [Hoeflea sp. BAL378]|uniref:NAD(P)-dependent oxidoreductase n=1 Tax=Hoeflea sp. BAL378 TaxID=1547437 RepID=UPI0005144D78|nr:NAD(P)-dependent oxidoreductase [Hoeflea sp. BAL378]KGF67092.1 3-hydroxyisobutyrate dehydrogenase [Hoeflea sp. BAL378]
MTHAKETVGFVGVGLMGHGMAKNIVEKGYPLTVHAHRNRAPVEDLLGRGATEAASLQEMAGVSSMIFLCLTGSPEVTAAVAALKPGLRRGSVIIDCSTSDPTVTERLAADLADIGVDFADAPLSRTPKEAWEGKLDCMVGATDAVFARIEPVIAAWAGKIVHVGGVGDGHKMKLLNNFISLGYAALYSEALAMSRKVGIPAAAFDKVIRGGRMDCGFYQTFMGYALEGNREAHRFTLSNAYKDIRYVESMANAATLSTTMASAVKNCLANAVANGGDGPEDYLPHLADFVARANGID